MNNPCDKITAFLDSRGVAYEIYTHEPVVTSEEAARVRGIDTSDGIKCIVLSTERGFALAILAGDRRLNSKSLRRALGVKDVRFADPEDVADLMGCTIGACYPLGNLLDVPVIADAGLDEKESVTFNAGRHDTSITMKWEDLKELIAPQMTAIVAV